MPICRYCGNEYSRITYHENFCKQNPNKKVFGQNSGYLRDEITYCVYCGKKLKNRNSKVQHEMRCDKNGNRIASSQSNLSNRGWSKGLSKETDQRVNNLSKSLKKHYLTHENHFKGCHHTEETKQHLSMVQTEIDHGAHGRNSHGKHGYYEGIYFMSTWELAYYIFTKDAGHKVERCLQRFEYYVDNQKHYYTPDFITDGEIVEVKGWESDLDKIKYQAVDGIHVLYYEQIYPMIEYVKSTYGVDNIEELYDRGMA